MEAITITPQDIGCTEYSDEWERLCKVLGYNETQYSIIIVPIKINN